MNLLLSIPQTGTPRVCKAWVLCQTTSSSLFYFLRFCALGIAEPGCMPSHLSRVRLPVTPWTVVCQAPLSMGFSRQGYCSGLPFLSLGDPPNPGIKPMSLASPALAGGFFTTSATWEVLIEPPKKTWVLSMALSQLNCVTLGKLHSLSGPP